MATLMMPAPAPTMAMNAPTLPLTPAKHENNALKAAAHNNNNGQKQGRYAREQQAERGRWRDRSHRRKVAERWGRRSPRVACGEDLIFHCSVRSRHPLNVGCERSPRGVGGAELIFQR